MPWGLWSSSSSSTPDDPTKMTAPTPPPPPPSKKKSVSWENSLNKTDWKHYTEPRTWGAPLLVVVAVLGLQVFYRSYLRRIPGTGHIQPGFFRRRSLFGKVTSVGDGDNFHLFHTPGGRLAGWGWLRKVPDGKKEVRGRTIPVRIAGIDAPEGAHFGRPAQPYSAEALTFLRSYILGRRVRAHIYKRDQYDRVVATVYVRRPPFFFPRRDVGYEMLKCGLATTYEAKTGVEFGGPIAERRYKAAEKIAKAKGKGMWAAEKGGFFGLGKGITLESPREYKDRIRTEGLNVGKTTAKKV